MDEFKGLGKPTEWAGHPAEPKVEVKPLLEVEPVEPEPVKPVEMPKKEPAPASDMHALASLMKKKLTSGNISMDPSVFPHVCLLGDFGDCDIHFSETSHAEVKVRCYVEKGFESVRRLLEFTQTVEKALRGECSVNEHPIKTHYIKHYHHSGAGQRYSTLFLDVAIRK